MMYVELEFTSSLPDTPCQSKGGGTRTDRVNRTISGAFPAAPALIPNIFTLSYDRLSVEAGLTVAYGTGGTDR